VKKGIRGKEEGSLKEEKEKDSLLQKRPNVLSQGKREKEVQGN